MLRELRETDVSGMLEWMHDEEIQSRLRKPVSTYTEKEALQFIRGAQTTPGGGVVFILPLQMKRMYI